MQFTAGLAVLLDLAGPQRLRLLAERLGIFFESTLFDLIKTGAERHRREAIASSNKSMSKKSIPRVWRLLANQGRWNGIAERYARLIAERSTHIDRARQEVKDVPPRVWRSIRRFNLITWTLVILAFIYASVIAPKMSSPVLQSHALMVAVLGVTAVAGPVANGMRFAVSLMFRVLPRSLLLVFVGAVAVILLRLLGEHSAGHPIRWIALVLFLCGFHFDLLGS